MEEQLQYEAAERGVDIGVLLRERLHEFAADVAAKEGRLQDHVETIELLQRLLSRTEERLVETETRLGDQAAHIEVLQEALADNVAVVEEQVRSLEVKSVEETSLREALSVQALQLSDQAKLRVKLDGQAKQLASQENTLERQAGLVEKLEQGLLQKHNELKKHARRNAELKEDLDMHAREISEHIDFKRAMRARLETEREVWESTRRMSRLAAAAATPSTEPSEEDSEIVGRLLPGSPLKNFDVAFTPLQMRLPSGGTPQEPSNPPPGHPELNLPNI